MIKYVNIYTDPEQLFSGTLIFDILKVSYYDMRLIHPVICILFWDIINMQTCYMNLCFNTP